MRCTLSILPSLLSLSYCVLRVVFETLLPLPLFLALYLSILSALEALSLYLSCAVSNL